MTDRIVGLLLLVVGVAYAASTSQIRIGFTSDTLGPRAVPYLLAAALVALSLTLILRPARISSIDWPSPPAAAGVAAAVASLVVYALLLERLGFLVSTTMELAFLSLLYGARAVPSVVSAVITTLLLYGLFNFLLGLRLPVGHIFGG